MTDRSSPSEQSEEAPAGEAGADVGQAADADPDAEAGTRTERSARRNRTEPIDDAPGDRRPDDERRTDRPPSDRSTDEPAAGRSEDGGPSLSGIFGGNPGDAPQRTAITPGDPSLENALFVLLGVLLSAFVLYTAWSVLTA